jgi:hypothetical protein
LKGLEGLFLYLDSFFNRRSKELMKCIAKVTIYELTLMPVSELKSNLKEKLTIQARQHAIRLMIDNFSP